jgi:hypothetical protein
MKKALGFTFLFVIISGILSGLFLSPLNYSMTGPSKNISQTMTSFAGNSTSVQLSIVGYLIEACAIVLLAVLLYKILKKENKVIAFWAFGLWILEAVFLAMRQIYAFCLLFVSKEFALNPFAHHLTLGNLFYELMHFSYDVQMIFYCVGGVMFYYLFFKSKVIPKSLSLFGIIVATIAFFGEVFVILGNVVPLYVFLPILLFELAIGFYLLLKK